MSPSGSGGGLVAGVRAGISAALAQLAQWFRLGPFGAASPPEQPQPGRPRLETPEQIVEQLVERGIAPEAPRAGRISTRWICVFTDDDTGEVLARLTETVDSPAGTYRIVQANQARRTALARLPMYLAGEDLTTRHISFRCRLVGGSAFNY